jgi:tyramine---L-glutamate ligase
MTLSPTIFVHEYISGGGWPAGKLPHGLTSEGLAMLWSVLSDFRDWGAVKTVTTLDDRIKDQINGLNCKKLPADEVVNVPAGQHEAVFQSLLQRSDAVLIIAPETDGILAKLTEIAEAARVPLLCSNSAAVKTASNKAICDRIFRQADLSTPDTRLTSFAAAAQAASELGYPLVTKPVDGTGCEGVYLVTRPGELTDTLALLRNVTSHDQILLQSFIQGIHASVSVLVAQDGAVPLSLNRQLIELGRPFSYSGGIIPFDHPTRRRAFDLAQAAVLAVPGLAGYVGVDMVLQQDQAWLIEINPRITTSYVGLHRILEQNLACAIWRACCEHVLPGRISFSGSIEFSKDNLGAGLEKWTDQDKRSGEGH